MLKGIEYLQERLENAHYISFFEAIYAIATEIDDWHVATHAMSLILNSIDFDNNRKMVFEFFSNKETHPNQYFSQGGREN